MSDNWVPYHIVVKTIYNIELPPTEDKARFLIEECDYLAANLIVAESVEILEIGK